MKKALTCILFILFACDKSSEIRPFVAVSRPITSTPDESRFPIIKKMPYQTHQWRLSWSDAVVDKAHELGFDEIAINSDDLSRVSCPGYKYASNDQRLGFWLVFIAAMAQQESSMNEKLRYFERSLNKYSEGLLQLSVSDSKYHDGCERITEETILVGEFNLDCGLHILKKQLDGISSRGIAPGTLFPKSYFYWSVLSKDVTINRISQFVKDHHHQLTFCY